MLAKYLTGTFAHAEADAMMNDIRYNNKSNE